MSATLLAVTFALLMAGPPAGGDPTLRYWGRLADGSGRARVEYRGALADVRAGDRIPGWGTVRAVTGKSLVLRRALTEAEKEDRAAAGLAAVDVLDMRIPLAAGNVAAPVAESR